MGRYGPAWRSRGASAPECGKRGRHRPAHLGDLIGRLSDSTLPLGVWLITDMAPRDLYPDRCRLPGDPPISSRYEEGTSTTMSIVAHTRPFVLGVDAQARSHPRAILLRLTGEILDGGQFAASPAGLQCAIAWVARRTGANLDTLWVIEGVGTCGARLARAAADAGSAVVEAARMNARANRGMGKSDPLDARRIAQAVADRGRTAASARQRRWCSCCTARPDRPARPHQHRAGGSDQRCDRPAIGGRSGCRRPRCPSASQITEIAVWRTRHDELAVGIARAQALCVAKRVRAGDRSYQPSLVSLTKEIQQTTRTRPRHHPRLPQPGPLPTQITAGSQRLPASRPLSFVTSR